MSTSARQNAGVAIQVATRLPHLVAVRITDAAGLLLENVHFRSCGMGLTIGGQPVVDDGIFSAIVISVMLTTMATPLALKWSFSRS